MRLAESPPAVTVTGRLSSECPDNVAVLVGTAPPPILPPSHVPSLPLRGPIDIVGAGDSVTANLTAALAAGASLAESLQMANAAASVVIHQLGTTGTASVAQIAAVLAAAEK